MGEGCGSWFPQHQFDRQSHDFFSLAAPQPSGQQRTNPEFINVGTNMVSTTGTLPVYANTELPHFRAGQLNENPHRFYCSPYFRQVFVPGSNSSLKVQLPANPYESHTENIIPKAGSGCAQKRFLVFDQAGDQTMVFSSTFGTPFTCLNSLGPKFPSSGNFNWDDPIAKIKPNVQSGPISTDEIDDNGTDVQSEMREDTEELNALLYSDDDSDSTDDDEVTSTGHSPSTMTAHYEQLVGGSEDFTSTAGQTKKRKSFDDSNDYVPLLIDTAGSANPIRCSEYEDDADSSCVNGQNLGSCDMYSSSRNKRMRKDKIRDTVSVLRSIIPGGEGKDAIEVLDVAIDYLKSLKLKAETWGLSTP